MGIELARQVNRTKRTLPTDLAVDFGRELTAIPSVRTGSFACRNPLKPQIFGSIAGFLDTIQERIGPRDIWSQSPRLPIRPVLRIMMRSCVFPWFSRFGFDTLPLNIRNFNNGEWRHG